MSWLESTEALVPIEAVQPGDQIRVGGVWLSVTSVEGAPGGRRVWCDGRVFAVAAKTMRLARAAP